MPFDSLAPWAQWSVLGLLTLIVGLVAVEFLRGNIVPAKRLDEAERRAEHWKHAWEVAMESQHQAASTLERLTELSHTFESLIRALPRGDGDGDSGHG